MILNERKIKILEAIINDYIKTAEPIGSRTIAKKYELGISSATIRNEMSDLEEMGFIVQPHASSGRVPSDKGYRLYVDTLMKYRELTKEETIFLQQMVLNNINQVDFLMQEIAKSIAVLTKYTTIVSEPIFVKTKIKHIQLVPLDENSIILLLVTDSKAVKNHVINQKCAPNYESLTEMSIMLNKYLIGLTFEDIDEQLARNILEKHREYSDTLINVLDTILNVIKQEDDRQIYTSGVKNILAFPEFSNLDKARALFQTLEEKEMLITLLGKESGDTIQIVIGSENNMDQMKDCSIIRANYKIGSHNFGNIGIIGPTRMDYVQVVSILNGIIKNINNVLGTLTGG